MKHTRAWSLSLSLIILLTQPMVAATPPSGGSLLDISSVDYSAFECEQGATVNPATAPDGAPAVKVTFPAGEKYPGVNFPIPGGNWDLSQFSGVEVTLINNGEENLNVGLRVDNPGNWKKSPWNTSNVWVSAGETVTIKVIFGESYGNPGFNLDPSKVKAIKLFASNPKKYDDILVTSIKAFGPPSDYSPSPTVEPQ